MVNLGKILTKIISRIKALEAGTGPISDIFVKKAGDTMTGTLTMKRAGTSTDALMLRGDSEGGNIDIYSGGSHTNYWEIDSYNGDLRVYTYRESDGAFRSASLSQDGVLTVPTVVGNLTGNCSGSSGSCTGNAATATKATYDSDNNPISTSYVYQPDLYNANTDRTVVSNRVAAVTTLVNTYKGKRNIATQIRYSDGYMYPVYISTYGNDITVTEINPYDGQNTIYYFDSTGTYVNSVTTADYVVASGYVTSSASGAYSVTWYYLKYNSGKAIAFGKTSALSANVTSAWGGIYESGGFRLALPSSTLGKSSGPTVSLYQAYADENGVLAIERMQGGDASVSGILYFTRGSSASITNAYVNAVLYYA